MLKKIYGIKCNLKNEELERVEIGILGTDGEHVRMDMHQYSKCLDAVIKKLHTENFGEFLTVEIEGGYVPHHARMLNNIEVIEFKQRRKMN